MRFGILDAVLARQELGRRAKLGAFDLPDEAEEISPRSAAEAVEETAVAVDGEGRRLFAVERTEPLPGVAGLLERRVLSHDVHDVGGRPDVGENALVEIESVAHARRHGSECLRFRVLSCGFRVCSPELPLETLILT